MARHWLPAWIRRGAAIVPLLMFAAPVSAQLPAVNLSGQPSVRFAAPTAADLAEAESAPERVADGVKSAAATGEVSSAGPKPSFIQTVGGCANCGPGLIKGNDPSAPPVMIESMDSGPVAGCASCGGCSDGCVPGRGRCKPCHAEGPIGKFFCGLYEAVNCPDQCYEPRFVPGANSAFFTDGARPVSGMKFRVDSGRNMILNDRAEYFWARSDGRGKGPGRAPLRTKYDELHYVTEAATGSNFSVAMDIPYRVVSPNYGGPYNLQDGSTNNRGGYEAGFSDFVITTKSLLLDTGLIQVAFQFATILPVGQSAKGLGVGHVSLEPSLIVALCLGHDTYLQAQVAEWIPLGGDDGYQGSILRHSFSLNQVLARPFGDTSLVGTLEGWGYSFQDGAYTTYTRGPTGQIAPVAQKASGYTYYYVGPGLRFHCADKVDFGLGLGFAVTDEHFAAQQYRFEFRYRY